MEKNDVNRKPSKRPSSLSLMTALVKSQQSFIEGADRHQVFDNLLNAILEYTSSEFGYIGEVHFEDGKPYQLSRAISNISWDENSRRYYQENWRDGLRFEDGNTLYGIVYKTEKVVIANDVANDPRSKGIPKGHPAIRSFLGIPIKHKDVVIGSIGLANRAGGYDSEIVSELNPLLSTCSVILSALNTANERSSALLELRKSEEKYRQLFDNLQEGVWVIDKDAYTSFVNPRMAEMLGYTQKEMVGRHLFEFMDEHDSENARDLLIRRQNGIKEQHEFKFMKKNKEKLFALIETTPLYDPDGNYSGALASVMDISEHVKYEEELKSERFKLQEYFENLPMLAYNVSFDGVIIDINNTAVKTLGYSNKSELIGKPLIPKIYAPASQEKAKKLIDKWKDEKVLKNEEMQIITKEGETIDVLLNADTIFDHKGTPMHSLSTHLDIRDRKRTEGALIISENLHKEAQRVAKIGHWELDSPSGTPVWSEEIFHIFGLDPKVSEPSFAAHENIIHTEDWPTLNQAITDLNDHGTSFDLEFRILRSDGEIRWMHAIGYAEKGAAENVVRMFGTAQDITKFKIVEEELKKSEQRLSAHLENTPVGAISWDLDFHVVEWNPGAESIFGYAKEEAIGKHAADLIIPEDIRDEIDEIFKELLNQTGGIYSTNENVTKNGSPIICEWYNTTLKDSKDNTIGVSSFVLDITERENNSKELIKEKETAQRYLNLAGVMFIGLDGKGNVNVANKKACDVLECTEPEIINQNWFDNHIPERLRDDVRSVFEQLMEGKVEPVEYYENPVLTKSGKEKQIAWHNTVIMDENNSITGILGSGEDITEKLKLQAQLNQAQKMESIGNLAGGIAHDFNNILSSIIGFTELALDEVSKGTTLEDSLHEVYTAGKRARDLVKQILAFARQSDEKIGPIQPSTTAKEVLHFIRSTIPTTIEIQQEIESESLIMGNATQVHQVLMNLCTNAAHAMEDSGGLLSVSLKDVVLDKELEADMRPRDYVEIKVSDTGVGVAPETINQIFEPYFTTKAPGEGTGMGLAMVQGVVESYGGKIAVESQVGKGTTFTIYLPVTKKRSARDAYAAEELPTGTERILFVDDEAPIAKMGSQILERLGYSVTIRTSSTESLELFQAKPNDFDLVVTDMTMPNMTGDKLAFELMKIRPDVPVILCTGYSKKISDDSATDIGIKAFAYKPIVKADLAKTVRKVLDEAKS